MKIDFYSMNIDDKERKIKVPDQGYQKEEIAENENTIVLETGDMRNINLPQNVIEMFERKHEERIRLTRAPGELERN